MKLEQAARQALEAIGDCSPNKALVHAAYALREALAEPVTEPAGRCKWCLAYNGHLDFCPALVEPKLYNHETGSVMIPNPLAEQAEQEPVAVMEVFSGWSDVADVEILYHAAKKLPDGEYKLYAAPVRTKDLTDDEIASLAKQANGIYYDCDCVFARTVIAADREKNK